MLLAYMICGGCGPQAVGSLAQSFALQTGIYFSLLVLGLQQAEKVVGLGRQTKSSRLGAFPLGITCQCVLGDSRVGLG